MNFRENHVHIVIYAIIIATVLEWKTITITVLVTFSQ